jgi:hypothetical protein
MPKRAKKPAKRGVMIVNIPMPDRMTVDEIEAQIAHVLGLLAPSLSLKDQDRLYKKLAMRCNELALMARVADKPA